VYTYTPADSIFDDPITNLLFTTEDFNRNPFTCSCKGRKKKRKKKKRKKRKKNDHRKLNSGLVLQSLPVSATCAFPGSDEALIF